MKNILILKTLFSSGDGVQSYSVYLTDLRYEDVKETLVDYGSTFHFDTLKRKQFDINEIRAIFSKCVLLKDGLSTERAAVKWTNKFIAKQRRKVSLENNVVRVFPIMSVKPKVEAIVEHIPPTPDLDLNQFTLLKFEPCHVTDLVLKGLHVVENMNYVNGVGTIVGMYTIIQTSEFDLLLETNDVGNSTVYRIMNYGTYGINIRMNKIVRKDGVALKENEKFDKQTHEAVPADIENTNRFAREFNIKGVTFDYERDEIRITKGEKILVKFKLDGLVHDDTRNSDYMGTINIAGLIEEKVIPEATYERLRVLYEPRLGYITGKPKTHNLAYSPDNGHLNGHNGQL